MSQFSGEMFAGSSTVTGNAPIDAHYLLTLANSALINAVVVGSYPFGTTDIANNAITDGKILGPITISKLSSYPFVNADIAVTAAIAYSKLNLAGSIQGTDFPNQNANLIFASPSSGLAATPTFRMLVAADLPTALQHALLDAFYNKDTVASAPVRGGIIIANSTPAWAQVPLAAVGQYLRSNGIDLLYSALLMGDASGILAIANGGTGSSSFPASGLIYSNGTILTQDNPNLFYDLTNKILNSLSGITSLQAVNLVDDYTKLLLHMNVDFADSSESLHSVTPVNSPTIDTNQSPPFGTGAGKFVAASNQYLSIPDSADWGFGTGNFTIDFLVKFNSLGAPEYFLVSQYQSSTNQWYVDLLQNAGNSYYIRFIQYTNSASPNIVFNNGGTAYTFSTGTWYHIAVVRSGSNWYAFVNGTQESSTYSNASSIPDSGGSLYIASKQAVDSLDGWLKEVRVSNGVARWTSNFTSPTRPYGTLRATDATISGKAGFGTTNPKTTADVRGSLSVNLVVKSVSNYTMAATDFAVIANGSNGAFTVTLPPANTEAGMFTFVIKSDGTSNVITVAAAGTDNIDGVASKGLNIQHESLLLISDGVGVWYSVGANTLPKDVSDSELTTTNATTVASFTPTSQGNFLVLIYFRVTTALTTVTISITYNDGTGAQTITPVNAAAEPVGSYTLVPVFINATTGAAIAVSATAGTANQVFVSASIQPV